MSQQYLSHAKRDFVNTITEKEYAKASLFVSKKYMKFK